MHIQKIFLNFQKSFIYIYYSQKVLTKINNVHYLFSKYYYLLVALKNNTKIL